MGANPFDEINERLIHIEQMVIQLLEKMNTPKREDTLITRREAAEVLGISLVTLGNWIKDGTLTAYRIGSRIRFKHYEVTEALNKIKMYGNRK